MLIVKLSALGDIIHALPVSAALKDAFPHLEITWAIEELFMPLVEGNPCLSSVLALPKVRVGNLRSASFLRDYFGRIDAACGDGIDLSIDLQGLTKSAVIALRSGAKTRIGYHWLREGARFVETPVPKRSESVHIVDQYLDVARFLGASPNKVRFPFFISADDEQTVEKALADAGVQSGETLVSINPASAQRVKEWGADRYATLMDTLSERTGAACVLVTADMKVANEVSSLANRPFVNLAGKTTLKQLASVLRRSCVHVCGDTGSGHLAAALETRVVSLMGPTDPNRACPYNQQSSTISKKQTCGAGCNGRHCAYPRPKCMEAITVAEVADTVIRAFSV